jgi:hypothetical protein
MECTVSRQPHQDQETSALTIGPVSRELKSPLSYHYAALSAPNLLETLIRECEGCIESEEMKRQAGMSTVMEIEDLRLELDMLLQIAKEYRHETDIVRGVY